MVNIRNALIIKYIVLLLSGTSVLASSGNNFDLTCSNLLSSPSSEDLINVVGAKETTIASGLFDTRSGKVVMAVQPPFIIVGKPSKDGLVRIQKVVGDKKAMYGFANLKGEIVIDFKFVEAGDIKDGVFVAIASEKKDWAYYDVRNQFKEIAIPKNSFVNNGFSEDRATVCIHDGTLRCAYINRNGELITDYIYKEARPFSHGLAAVKPVGSDFYGYIDRSGNMIIPPQFKSASKFSPVHAGVRDSEVVAVVQDRNRRFGYIRKDGSYFISPQFAAAEPFSEGLAATKGRGSFRWGFINSHGDMMIAPQYFFVLSFSDGLAAVKTNPSGNWIYIDRNGTKAFEGQFTQAGRFVNGYAKVEHGMTEILINNRGEHVIVADFTTMLSAMKLSWDAFGPTFSGKAVLPKGFPAENTLVIPKVAD